MCGCAIYANQGFEKVYSSKERYKTHISRLEKIEGTRYKFNRSQLLLTNEY